MKWCYEYAWGLILFGFRPSLAREYANLRNLDYTQSIHGFNRPNTPNTPTDPQ